MADVPDEAAAHGAASAGSSRRVKAKRSKAAEAAGDVIDALSEAAKKRLADEGRQQ